MTFSRFLSRHARAALAASTVSVLFLAFASGCTESAGDSSLGGGGDGGGGAPADGEPGLLGCELPLNCFIDSNGTYHSPSDEGMFCAAQLLVSGAKGAILFEDIPGGGGCAREHLYLLDGNGNVVRQSREWQGCGQMLYEPTPFKDATPQESCQVQVPAELIAACEAESSPSTSVSVSSTGSGIPGDDCRTLVAELLTGCVPIEPEHTCESATALVQ